METTYYSQSGGSTVAQAKARFGDGHLNWLRGDWQVRLTAKIRLARKNRQGDSRAAYCALMQAGEGATE